MRVSSNVFLSDAHIASALRINDCLQRHKNDLAEFAECVGFKLLRVPYMEPGDGIYIKRGECNYIVIGKGDQRDELITTAHECFHLLHSPTYIESETGKVQVIREESRANAFAGLVFVPRLRRYEDQQAVYNLFGPNHPDVAYARLLHEARHPSWI